MLTVAEDSGLVIDALDGEPGVRSARFLRPDASYPERFAAIFERLARHPELPRTARFVCALAVADGDRIDFEAEGIVEGVIADAVAGSHGFGYDPIFYYPPYQATLAEVTEHDKLAVAHRGQAFRALADWIAETGSSG
jgi:XTP/dITP diphosphohydrolase